MEWVFLTNKLLFKVQIIDVRFGTKAGQVWSQMEQIRDFFRSDFSNFGSSNLKKSWFVKFVLKCDIPVGTWGKNTTKRANHNEARKPWTCQQIRHHGNDKIALLKEG